MTLGKHKIELCKGDCGEKRYIVYVRGGLCNICNIKRKTKQAALRQAFETTGKAMIMAEKGITLKEAEALIKKKRSKKKKTSKVLGHLKGNSKQQGRSKKPLTKKTTKTLKKDLWSLFTLCMKLESSIDGWCWCMSCDRPIKIGTIECQGGHYHPKKGYPFLYFHEDNVWPQCSYCNGPLEGNRIEYEKRLSKKIGEERMQWMEDNKFKVQKWSRYDLYEKIEYYKQRVSELKKTKSFEV